MQYYIILVIIILLATFFSSNSKKTTANTILVFSICLLFLFGAFRIGFTPDYYNYEFSYDNPDVIINNGRHSNELLFLKSIKYLTYRWALIIQAFLLCLCLYIALKNYVARQYWPYSFIIFFFCTSFFLGNLSGYRSSFVTIGLFLAIWLKHKYKRGWIMGLAIMIAASYFHQSGWIMIPLLFIPSKPLSQARFKTFLLLSIIVIVISLFAANKLNSLIKHSTLYFEEYESYMKEEISNTITIGYFTVLRLALLLFLFLYSLNFCKRNIPGIEIVFVQLTTIFFLINILPGIGMISRFLYYFTFTSIAGFGVMVKHEKNSKLRLGFIIAFILFSIWSFYLLAHTSYYKTTYMIYDSVLFL